MLYVIFSQDIEDSLARRVQARPAHVARLQALNDVGRLFVAGPHPRGNSDTASESGFTGSTVIAEFDSLEVAKKWADADPYVLAGVYANVTVKPFIKVLP